MASPLALDHRGRWFLFGTLTAVALLLGWHVHRYWFLTDDAYISFRYACNLAQGLGLSFNPGDPPVEGYTNFLWVVLLALGRLAGIAPETSADLLSAGLTFALWGLVVWFSLRSGDPGEPSWPALIPPLFLAACRSFAVWATSGLETRLFELLIVGALLRLVVEVQSEGKRKPLSALLFALGTLTRPDGLLIFGMASLAAAGVLGRRGILRASFALPYALTYGLIVGAHFLFRWTYYGEWLPNTYYAKVGEPWWELGLAYLGSFILEYAMYLWIPLLWAAWQRHRERDTLEIPLIFAAAVLPHAFYMARIGGDHFEYRPLDLYLPLLFLLLGDGLRKWASLPRARFAGMALAGLCLYGIWALPNYLHTHHSKTYLEGWPGLWRQQDIQAERYLRDDLPVLYRLPLFEDAAEALRRMNAFVVSHFGGIRQEEHSLFLATVVPEGEFLGRLRNQGVLPDDTRIACNSVGAIPYYSSLPTFDRHGLTDKDVARMAVVGEREWIAHEKMGTIEQARAKGVLLWGIHDVHLLGDLTDVRFLRLVWEAHERGSSVYVADAGEGRWFLVRLPLGLEETRKAIPELEFRAVEQREVAEGLLRKAASVLEARISEGRGDETALDLAWIWRTIGEEEKARALYGRMIEEGDSQAEADYQLGMMARDDRDLALAANRMQQALRADQNFVPAEIALGNLARLRKEPEAAKRHYFKVLDRLPLHLNANLNLAAVFEEEDEWAAAGFHYLQALRAARGHEAALLGLAGIREKQSRFEEAEGLYRAVLEKHPKNAEARVKLARLEGGGPR